MSRIEDLKAKRTEARTAADSILTRAQTEERDLTDEETVEFESRQAEAREASDAIEEFLETQVAEVRAAATREPEVQTRTLADVVLERGWNLTTNPSVEIPASDLIETRASTL